MLLLVNFYLQLITALTGIAVIFIPLLGFRHAGVRARGRSSGAAIHLLRWPMTLVLTIGYVAIGIALWRPLPIIFSSAVHFSILIIGSLLYFPGIALYLWGYFMLGRMFGISSGFGATLYQDHKLIRNGPYRFVRHPMYLAVILAAFGALLIFRARQEERLLAEEFGEEWQRYRRDVPGWLPTLRKRVK